MTRGSSGLLALCVVLAFIVAACGGSGGGGGKRLSPAAYKSKLAEISKQVDAAHGNLSRGARAATTIVAVQAVLRQYAAAEERFGAEVSKLNPPANADAANTELASGERDDATEIRALLPKLAKLKSPQEAFAYLQTVSHTKGGEEQTKALAELKKLGYTNGS